ncbi:hypothetical protein KSP40_PGU005659 [Platanthera guangdongensis]|uniref:Transcription repressor n=1 Tax=Platanthera guangdongensis TaxID=2320717 RepID=A0ABR2M364_9ASPA
MNRRKDISCSERHFSLGELELRPISGYWDWDLDPPPKRGETRPRGQRMRPKVKVRSPRAAQRRVEERKGGWRSLEGFATVKMSSDPEKDFRESMVEMIREKRMRRPEEMKSLLACYINLNADDHHGLILKAFRQVWLDLNPFLLAGGGCHCCQFCEHC